MGASHDRALLIAHSLVEVYCQQRWERTGLFGLMNRILFLAQVSVVVAVYRKVGAEFILELHTLWDAHFRPQFDDATRSLHDVDLRTGRRILKDKYVKLLRQVFDLEYYFLFYEAPLRPDEPDTATFSPVTKWRPWINRLFATLFQTSQEITGQPLFAKQLSISANTIIAATVRHEVRSDPLQVQLPHSYKKSTETIQNAFAGLEAAAETIYRRFANSPLLRPHDQYSANIMLFARIFDRPNTNRFGVYHYDVRLLMGDTQQADLHKALVKHRSQLIKRSKRLSRQVSEGRRLAEEEFRAELATTQGCAHLIAVMRTPCEVNMRHFTEYPISSGVTNVRTDPDAHYGLCTILPRFGGNLRMELLRDTTIRHVLYLMRPDAEGRGSILQVPIRLGGAHALCAVTVRPFAEAPRMGWIDDVAFTHAYHFTSSIVKHAARRLRRMLEVEYLEQAGRIWEDAVWMAYKQHGRTGSPVNFESVLTYANNRLFDLTRVFPYRRITVEYVNPTKVAGSRPSGGQSGHHKFLFQQELTYRIRLAPNPWFDQIGDEPFLTTQDVESAFRQHSELVSQRVIHHQQEVQLARMNEGKKE